MRSLLEPTFGVLLEALGPLLGGSWASLGRPWASKMGSKRVTPIEEIVFVIPSCCFFRYFSLRSASGTPLGRVLAPSWPHLGPILAYLGPLGAIFGPSGYHLGAILAHLGPILAQS